MKLLKVLALGGVVMTAQMASALSVGEAAPAFSLVDEKGTLQSLAKYQDKTVVLFFGTARSVSEINSLRDKYDVFAKNNVVVFVVNGDTPATHEKFIAEHRLPFNVLTDTNNTVAKAYDDLGASEGWKAALRKQASKVARFVVARRVAFVIKDGKVAHIIKGQNDVAQSVIEALKLTA